MIQSMTGFGRGEAANDKYKITLEMKSVNHRFLDISIRLPRKLNFFEAAIRKEVKKYATRGKVDLFIWKIWEMAAKLSVIMQTLLLRISGVFSR